MCGSSEWGTACTHGEHDMSCEEDNERFKLIEDVRLLISALRGSRPVAHDADDWDAMMYPLKPQAVPPKSNPKPKAKPKAKPKR